MGKGITFKVWIDLELAEIQAAYMHHLNADKKPTKKELANWIAGLAEADIVSCLPNDEG